MNVASPGIFQLDFTGLIRLDTITQAEIISSHRSVRADLGLFGAGQTMLEAADKVAEEHERNSQLFLLLLWGLRALDAGPADPSVVAEAYLLKLLSISGFHPSLTACASCGAKNPRLFSSSQGGAVCDACAEPGAVGVEPAVLDVLQRLSSEKLAVADAGGADPRTRARATALLTGFVEYYLERQMRSMPMLEGTPTA